MRCVSQGDNPQRLFRYQKMMLTHFRTVKIIPNLSINGRLGCWNHSSQPEPETILELKTRSSLLSSFLFYQNRTSTSLFFWSPQWSYSFTTKLKINQLKIVQAVIGLNKLLGRLVISTILIVSLHSLDWKAITAAKKALTTDVEAKNHYVFFSCNLYATKKVDVFF